MQDRDLGRLLGEPLPGRLAQGWPGVGVADVIAALAAATDASDTRTASARVIRFMSFLAPSLVLQGSDELHVESAGPTVVMADKGQGSARPLEGSGTARDLGFSGEVDALRLVLARGAAV